ncbi:MAG: rhodanese-like domain-containing protein [Caulobacterales bacterium]|jgi:hypothetical protein
MSRSKLIGLSAGVLVCCAALASAQPVPKLTNPQIDYPGFLQLTAATQAQRDQRLITFADFQRRATEPDTLILDARSADAFARGHLAGAVNLPLTDFTAESLARVIGDPNRPILIYCNNNFSNHINPVPLKLAPLALNIQTFINLNGYGFTNVYELNDVLDFNDPRVDWVRSDS